MQQLTSGELQALDWRSAAPGITSGTIEQLQLHTAQKLPWDELFPVMGVHQAWIACGLSLTFTLQASRFSVAQIQSINPQYFSAATPQLLGGLQPHVFGELPMASFNMAPAEAFKYVRVGKKKLEWYIRTLCR